MVTVVIGEGKQKNFGNDYLTEPAMSLKKVQKTCLVYFN